MMTLKEISVSVGRTVNLGNFESLRVDVSATATVDYSLGENEDDLREKMSAWLKQQVHRTITEQKINE
jgi:hypothetical protein